MRLPILASLLLAASAVALPNPDTRFRPGANHHVGDDSFVDEFGRRPTDSDDEHVRMRVHLEHVRAWLAARPATRPDLAERRAELLGYLDDYIARGITPTNAHLPWRTAVFIDDANRICAVGYLIERSAGRTLPERIASEHRYDFLEDIAVAIPEVADWVATSGFTLDELASIQPAYSNPHVEEWRTWDLVKHAPADGEFEQRGVSGTFKNKAMQGTWTVREDGKGEIVGKGELVNGTGSWRSFYPDGKRVLAEGRYRDNVASGPWTFYHPSGNVAAEGQFRGGMRVGRWRFYTDSKTKTLLATGRFAVGGSVTGRWTHYDADGKLLAHTYSEGGGDRVDVVATADGVVHQQFQFEDSFNPPVEQYRQTIERFSRGTDQVYVFTSAYRHTTDDVKDPSIIYDADGNWLSHDDGGWHTASCHWPAYRKALAHRGELAWLAQILFSDAAKRAIVFHKSDYGGPGYNELVGDPGPTCDAPVAVPEARGKQLDALVAPRTLMRAQSPTFVRKLVLREELDDSNDADKDDDSDNTEIASDLRRVLGAYTIGYVEWPHIDGRFERVFNTMAGRMKWEWFASEPEADGTDPNQNMQAERAKRK